MIPVLIVDSQRAFVEALCMVLDAQHDLECVGTAQTAEEGRQLAAKEQPEVVVIDVRLPDLDGVRAAELIRCEVPSARVVLLSGHRDATVLARAAAAGASAFLLKDSSIDEILDAVRQPATTRIQVDSRALQALIEPAREALGLASLTQRELEVLGLMAEGRQPKQIAHELGITTPTCRGYVRALQQKLGAHSALEAVVLAHRYGVIQLPGSRSA